MLLAYTLAQFIEIVGLNDFRDRCSRQIPGFEQVIRVWWHQTRAGWVIINATEENLGVVGEEVADECVALDVVLLKVY